MQLNDYQQQALKSVPITDKTVVALAHRTLGITGEVGIVANAVKKVIRDQDGKLTANDVTLLKEKLGDVLYYVSVLAEYADLNLEDIAQANLKKSAKFKASRKRTG